MIQKHNHVHSIVVENLLPNPAEQSSNPLPPTFYTNFHHFSSGQPVFYGPNSSFIPVLRKNRRFTGLIPVQLLTGLLRLTGPAEAVVRSFTGPNAGPVRFK
jgi:hypothetical protein